MLLLVWCVCVHYLNRYRFIRRHAVTGLPKHHIRNGDIALRLVVQLQDRHLPSVVGHIKVVVRHPVLNKLCMHRSPAPLQRSTDQDKSVISCDYWSLHQDHIRAPLSAQGPQSPGVQCFTHLSPIYDATAKWRSLFFSFSRPSRFCP